MSARRKPKPEPEPKPKPEYGIDGYPYVVGLGAAALLLGVGSLILALRGHAWIATTLGLVSVLPAAPALLGLRYVLHGKLVHRDRLLGLVAWTGNERVLDVGTGGGVLLIGAAKRVPAGHACGIDIWSAKDLSGNTKARVLRNAVLEGVADRVDVRDDDARSMSFEAASFDVVLTMLCLHNIEARQDEALRELVRRPGGIIVFSDLAGTARYAEFFRALGLRAEEGPTEWGTFPFQRIVTAKKPG